jgi:dolichyl-phosphate-mannose--protein O-mannosyl transferase
MPLGIRLPFDWGWVPGPIRSLGSWTYQAYEFHIHLDSGHAYASGPWSWLVLGRPVDFYYKGTNFTTAGQSPCGAKTCAREILLIGTPILWWAFVPMLLWLAWHWLTTRDWRAGAVWMAFIAGWLVWFMNLNRTMFLFYMAPLVPFLIIGLTMALGAMIGPGLPATVEFDEYEHEYAARRRRWGVAGASLFMALVIADFVWMWPIFTGGLLSYNDWHAHMWLPSWV